MIDDTDVTPNSRLERWKERYELSGRQVFFLFFGAATTASLLFVLGIVVGKRMEARAIALMPPPAEDPLAALDQLSEGELAADSESMTFYKTLSAQESKAKPAEAKVAAAPVAKPTSAPVVVTETATSETAEPMAVAKKPEPLTVAKKVEAPAPVAPAAVPAKPAAAPRPVAPQPVVKEAIVKETVAAHMPKVAAPVVTQTVSKKGGPRFTLQLSAFPERTQADEFVKKMAAAGYKPFVVQSQVPQKGTFFRVRVGDYTSLQAAVDAKNDFEKKQRMIAYVAKL